MNLEVKIEILVYINVNVTTLSKMTSLVSLCSLPLRLALLRGGQKGNDGVNSRKLEQFTAPGSATLRLSIYILDCDKIFKQYPGLRI